MEGTTEKTGGMAFDVILKPASSEAAPPPHVAGSPTRERPLSQGDIDRKLKEAEERRLVMYCLSEIVKNTAKIGSNFCLKLPVVVSRTTCLQ